MDKNNSLIKQGSISIAEIAEENASFIYSTLFYIAGLLAGSLLFKTLGLAKYDEIFKAFLLENADKFLSVFLEKLAIYLIIYVVTILIGLCIIGFPIINIIPLLCGFEIALKLCYYYNLYNSKGIGYSLLMIVPQAAAFITVLFFTIEQAKLFSKTIFDAATNKINSSELVLTSYLKSFLINAVIVLVITSINSLLIYLFNSIISI